MRLPDTACRRSVGSIAVVTFLALCGVWCAEGKEPPAWKVVKGKHFIVHHRDDRAFADKAAARAEEHYRTIAADLGFTKYGDFWTWDKRVKIFIYPTQAEFMRAVGAPKWAAGKATYSRKEIATFEGSGRFLESVLPHELAHLVLRDFIGFTGKIPLWLDEGVAQWAEKGERTRALERVRRLAARNRLTSLKTLMVTDVRQLKDPVAVADFYAQSVSLVGFLKKQGTKSFRVLCGHLRDGKKLGDALRFTYPAKFRNIQELEVAWKKALTATRAESKRKP